VTNFKTILVSTNFGLWHFLNGFDMLLAYIRGILFLYIKVSSRYLHRFGGSEQEHRGWKEKKNQNATEFFNSTKNYKHLELIHLMKRFENHIL